MRLLLMFGAFSLLVWAAEPLHTIPFTTHANGAYVNVRINGSRPMQFLFDTAAANEVINSRVADAAKLGEPWALAQAQGAGDGTTTAKLYRDVKIDMGGVPIVAARLGAIDLAAIEARKGFRLDGLLAAPVLLKYVIELDTGASVMRLYDPETFQYSGNGETIPVRYDKQGQPHIKAIFVTPSGKEIEGDFKVDSAAAEATVMLAAPFVEKHGLLQQWKPEQMLRHEVFGVGGGSALWTARARAIRVGRTTFEWPTFDMTQAKGGTLASGDIAGIIGGELLHRFRVFFDAKRGVMHLEPTDRLKGPFEQEMAGLRWSTSGEGLREFTVRLVFPNSPAAKAGVLVGDKLVSVDGRPASAFDKDALYRHLERPGKRVRFEFLREGKPVQVTLQLERLV